MMPSAPGVILNLLAHSNITIIPVPPMLETRKVDISICTKRPAMLG